MWDFKPLAAIEQISVEELHARLSEAGAPQVVDVRGRPEWNAGHIRGATHVPLDRLESNGMLDRSRPVAVICAGGYRSSIGTGILERLGFARVSNVVGGMSAWTSANLPVEAQS